ncbi:hypothetical protein ASE92_12325 [Pedobacter sp. Leaf41]|jgi:hypothetical protein|uniref:hypothetical protein n=1 Tax=Pedobacter sp. Leaf41 TaxID=1736218 RepID=UPI00070354DC|nr:hypothetical protein [Pedobacter sp. Leaf41]KQN34734.1 hypothetical protein ASE92_12325 [Pedobacter sp. Leaf41]RZL36477.1 MAG: hypothetical protein EOO96_06900 [Pedobacter sp.]
MKKTVQIFSMLLIALTVMVSCKKDTDPADRDFFVGTYRGTVTYSKGDTRITSTDGKVTVTKVDDTYSFFFGNNIPDITGVKFQESGNTYISVGTGVIGITIDASTLKIGVANSNGNWTANATR